MMHLCQIPIPLEILFGLVAPPILVQMQSQQRLNSILQLCQCLVRTPIYPGQFGLLKECEWRIDLLSL